MGIILLIIQVISLIAAMPKLIKDIRKIIDLIKMLRNRDDRKEARAELASILQRHNVKKTSTHPQGLKKDLEDLEQRLRARIKETV